MTRGRLIAAYILSPFAGAIYMFLLLWLLNQRNKEMLGDYIGIASTVGLFALVGYLAEGILGTPLLCWFRRRGYLSLLWFLLGGFAIGIVVWLFFLLYLIQLSRDWSFGYKLIFGLLGCIAPALISSTVFWLLGWAADNKSLDRSHGKRLSQQA